jgi:DNA-directed RNA polymerase III subunit RPC4
VKNEDGEDEPGPSKPRLSKSSGGPTIKREDGGHNSSEDEDDEDQVERRNIDEMIVISSDDEQTGASNRVPKSHGLLPVRIGRREHQDRVIGINTEASSAASAKILQQAEASGKAIKVEADAVVPRKSKGKGKAKDVEITGERRPYKGMWQDADDSAMQVKSEPLSDEEMIDAVPLGNSEAPPGEDAGKKTKSKKKKKKDKKSKNKKRKSRTNGIPIPVLQTDEDRAEWKRYKESLELARLMLGPKKKGKEKEKEKLVDAAGDTTMKEAGAESNEKQANEDDEVYLFHFPSNMPKPLSDITIKTEPSESEKPVAKPGKAGDAKDPKVGDDKAAIRKPRAAVVPPGLAGKLRVHKSGRITLKWGRQKFDVRPGHPTSFVEGTVNVETVPPSMRIVREEAGESVPYGALKEKFTVMPNWDQMLRY